MRNPKRIKKILKEIEFIWEDFPDFRLGQLIGNVLQDPTLYYIEDDQLVEMLKKYYGGLYENHNRG